MEQIPEPDSDVAGMLIISDWKFKMTVINMLRVLMDKLDNLQKQMLIVRREIEILRNKQIK